MNPTLKLLCSMSGIKMKEIFVDEHKQIGWTSITCTDIELERFYNLIITHHNLLTGNKDEKLERE